MSVRCEILIYSVGLQGFCFCSIPLPTGLADTLEAVLGRMGQREDPGCVEDGVDVSVGVGVGAGVGVDICQ